MAKLGRFEYPETGLAEAVLLGRRIAREFGGEVSRSGLARSLGMSERGGAFAARLAAARMWGVCSGRGTVRLTPEGLRAAEPRSTAEADAARGVLARSVPLFAEIARRVRSHVVDEARVGVLLEEITGAGRLETGRRAAQITRLVNEVLAYLASERPAEDERDVSSAGARSSEAGERSPMGSSEGDRIELVLPDGRLSLPESVTGLDAAMLMLRARRESLAARERSTGGSGPPERPF